MSSLVELNTQECWDLLARHDVARVALCAPTGPQILPVNYTVHGESLFFRTTPYSALGTYGREANLAVEIDSLDSEAREGWSVVAVGRGEMVSEAEELREVRAGWDPTPWAGGQRYLYVRVRVREVTGRRLAQPRARPAPV